MGHLTALHGRQWRPCQVQGLGGPVGMQQGIRHRLARAAQGWTRNKKQRHDLNRDKRAAVRPGKGREELLWISVGCKLHEGWNPVCLVCRLLSRT